MMRMPTKRNSKSVRKTYFNSIADKNSFNRKSKTTAMNRINRKKSKRK